VEQADPSQLGARGEHHDWTGGGSQADGRYLFRASGEPWRSFRPATVLETRYLSDGGREVTECIADGTRLLARLDFPDGGTAAEFGEVFEGILSARDSLRVGAGSGELRVEASSWSRVPSSDRHSASHEDVLTVTLESDLIATKPGGGWWDSLGLTSLSELSGHRIGGGHEELTCMRIVDGEPPRMLRGSVVRIEGAAARSLRARLLAVPAVGDRTWEGCGRLRLDFDPLADNEGRAGSPPSTVAPLDEVVARREAVLSAAWTWADKCAKRVGPSAQQWRGLLEELLRFREASARQEHLLQRASRSPWTRVPLEGLARACGTWPGSEQERFFQALVERIEERLRRFSEEAS
jgi:hypothetical protein